MNFSLAASLLAGSIGFLSTATAFAPPSLQRHQRKTRQLSIRHEAPKDLHRFDHLLQEVDVGEMEVPPVVSRRRVVLTNDGTSIRTIVLASSSFPGAPVAEEAIDEDPYASALDGHMGKIRKFEEQQQVNTFESKIKSMNFNDIILTFIVPGIATFAGARWALNKLGGRVANSADETLDSFAREMVFHDGDFKETEYCVKDYKKKLTWMGPKRNEAMLKRYLEVYAKKKTVSPQAIASLSNVFTLFQLSEEKVAKLLVELCRQMGTDKISSAGKLLFFGSRILKSPEGVAALQPIKKLIMSTYSDAEFAEKKAMVETSQQAIAEAAYRTAVLNAGKNQSGLTPGFDVLGLDRETATRIFNEEKKEGFVSDRVSMYGGQTRKYDKEGRQIDDKGKLVDPTGAPEADDEPESTSNVYECGQCGYTLFVATGRESKFFGSDFKCPECGAAKKEFIGRDDVDS